MSDNLDAMTFGATRDELRELVKKLARERDEALNRAANQSCARGQRGDATQFCALANDALRQRDEAREALAVETKTLRQKWAAADDEICQILGKALGYPWFKDDPENFPDATAEDGVCVGDNIALSLVDEAAKRLGEQEKLLALYREALERVSTANNLLFIWDVSYQALKESKS